MKNDDVEQDEHKVNIGWSGISGGGIFPFWWKQKVCRFKYVIAPSFFTLTGDETVHYPEIRVLKVSLPP